MFGAPLTVTWGISYVKNGTTYYLASIENDGSKFVWTTKKDKAKKYATGSTATVVAETIKKSYKNKKEINVIQV